MYVCTLTCPVLVVFVAVGRFRGVVVAFDENIMRCGSVQGARFAAAQSVGKRDICICFGE